MPTRRQRGSHTLAVKAAELAFAVPQVVAHRVARMALSGPTPSPRDRKEFARMVAEKNVAFGASWQAMTAQAVRAQQAFATSWFQSFLTAAASGRAPSMASAAQLQRANLAILSKGLAPVHRKAVANAKRLARVKLR